MKKMFFIMFLALFLVACVEDPVCNKPYFEYKQGECCVDENENNICDRDESSGPIQNSSVSMENTSGEVTTQQQIVIAAPNNKEKVMKDEIPVDAQLAAGKQNIINNFVQKVRSVEYTYLGSRYFIKPPNVGIVLDTIKPFGADEKGENLYIDTVYLEMTQKIAFAGCEAQEPVNAKKCKPLWQQLIEVGYGTYNTLTPFDWIERLHEGTIVDYKKKYVSVDQRIADYAVFEYNGQLIEMWVDGEFGVPLKIREAQKANVHTFQQLTINSVEDTDVLPLEERQAVEVI